METETIDGKTLDRLKAMFRMMFSQETLTELTAEPMPWAGDMIELRFKTSLLGLMNSVEQVPLNWWQACRQRWLPTRWLYRHPVKTRDIKIYGAVYFKPSDDPFWGQRGPGFDI